MSTVDSSANGDPQEPAPNGSWGDWFGEWREWGKRLQRDHAFGFYSFLFTAVAAVFGVGFSYFTWESPPSLVFERRSSSPVVSVLEDVDRLEVTYDGEPLIGGTLFMTVVRLKNEGGRAVTVSDFQQDAPLGLVIDGGGTAVGTPRVIDASDGDLKRIARVHIVAPNELKVSPVMLNPSDYVEFSFLTMGTDDAEVTLRHQGRVANTSIDAVESGNEKGWTGLATEALWITVLAFASSAFAAILATASAARSSRAREEFEKQVEEQRERALKEQRERALKEQEVARKLQEELSELSRKIHKQKDLAQTFERMMRSIRGPLGVGPEEPDASGPTSPTDDSL